MVGLNRMFAGGTIWFLTHGQIVVVVVWVAGVTVSTGSSGRAGMRHNRNPR